VGLGRYKMDRRAPQEAKRATCTSNSPMLSLASIASTEDSLMKLGLRSVARIANDAIASRFKLSQGPCRCDGASMKQHGQSCC